jgi:Tfp pilus assembly protein PilF
LRHIRLKLPDRPAEESHVESLILEAKMDPHVRNRLEGFSVDPSDVATFRLLEEELFLGGSWEPLAGVYERRLSVLEPGSTEWRDLLFRLGELLEDRIGDSERARARYEELLRVAPQDARALGQLRRLHARAGSLTSALQIADVEEALPLGPVERARVLAEVGALWAETGETAEAEGRFRDALTADPHCEAALAGQARLAEARGDTAEAMRLHELRLAEQVGAARAETLERLATLSHGERARTYLREALEADPRRRTVIERLLEVELGDGPSERTDRLRRALWDIATETHARRAIALAAATDQLDAIGSLADALEWVTRAEEIGDGDAAVQELRARVFRRAGQKERLIDALEQLVSLQGPTAMRLLELSVLHERAGRPERALDWLQSHLEREPDDAEALAALDRCLGQLQRHGERADVLQRRVELTSDSGERAALLTSLGDLHADALDDPGAAEAEYRRAFEDDPGGAAGERLSQLLRKRERFADLAETLQTRASGLGETDESIGLWCELGELRLGPLDDVSGARDAFRAALEQDPRSPRAIAGLHRVAEGTQDPAWHLEACERELALDLPDARRAELLASAVSAAVSSGDSLRARNAAEAWVEFSPGPDSLIALARIARALGDSSREQSALIGLADCAGPESSLKAEALARLGDLALEQSEADSLERAAHWYREAVSAGAEPSVRERLIDLYRRLGDLPALAEELRSAIRGTSGSVAKGFVLELSGLLAETGDLDGAIETLQTAVRGDPAWQAGADQLGSLLEGERRLQELADLLDLRLSAELDLELRRPLAARRAELLLDVFSQPREAAEVARELLDPTRCGTLEAVFERALESAREAEELTRWLELRVVHAEGDARAELLLRLAALQRDQRDLGAAIETLRRADRACSPEGRSELRASVLGWIRESGDAHEQHELLGLVLDQTGSAEERVELRVERARLRAGPLGDASAALGELDLAALEGPLRAGGLRLLAAIAGETGDAPRRLAALEGLATESEDPEERVRTLLALADLRTRGPEPLLDPHAAEAALRSALEVRPASLEAFIQLSRLLEDANRRTDLASLLRSRLELDSIGVEERGALALRLSQLGGDADLAIAVLREALERGAERHGLIEELHSRLAETSDFEGCAGLCEEELRRADAEGRAFWAERWLRTREHLARVPEQELEAVESLLADAPRTRALVERRIRLLRELDRPEPLAHALEHALELESGSDSPHRVLRLGELVALLEGRLDDPRRALDWLERGGELSPELLARGARLAARGDEPAREAAFLSRLVDGAAEGAPARPEWIRRLGLALCRTGSLDAAEPHLRRSLEVGSGDREIVDALESILRGRDDRAGLLQILDSKFALEPAERRLALAREGFELAERIGADAAALSWLRRAHSLEPLELRLRQRRVELEGECGDRAGLLDALASLAEAEEDPRARARALATAAALHEERGDLELARQLYAEAVHGSHEAEAGWLQAQERLLDRLCRPAERAEVLRQLAEHPEVDPAQREQHAEMRMRVLASHPELQEEAALQLRLQVESDDGASVAKMRQLLALYDSLSRAADWCSLAERLRRVVADEERVALERELARRLWSELGDRWRSVAVWSEILANAPDDDEALASLSELLDAPGSEAQRAGILERRARAATASPQSSGEAAADGGGGLRADEIQALLLLAARLRFESLGDAPRALENLERALELDRCSPAAHELRARICQRLDRPEEELQSLHVVLQSGRADAARGESVRADEGSAPLWLRLAALLAEQPGRREEALRAAESCLALAQTETGLLQPLCDLFERLGEWTRTLEILREELSGRDPNACAPLLREIARIAWEGLGDAVTTSEALEALIDLEPLGASEEQRLSEALEALGETERALEHRRAALETLGEAAKERDWLDLGQLALERGDLDLARHACDRALDGNAESVAALAVRAEVHQLAGDAGREIEDRVGYGARAADGQEAAISLTRAARLAHEALGDPARARHLYLEALGRDPTALDALVGGGKLAVERSDWSEAERLFGMACGLIADGSQRQLLARVAQSAAGAALEQDRFREAFRYLELALAEQPEDSQSLERMGQIALQLGEHTKARECIEARLVQGSLGDTDHAEWLRRLAQACEATGDEAAATEHLERAIELQPEDEVARARVVDLLERRGERRRAIDQLDAWATIAQPEYRANFALRAARLEIADERKTEALERLTALVDADPGHAEAWCEIAELSLELSGPQAPLGMLERCRSHASEPEPLARLAWVEARAHEALGHRGDAARCAAATLEFRPDHLEAARLLAQHLGQSGDFEQAVRKLECALAATHPPAHIEAELADAIGRSYAGPLEDIERAERSFRRALECNPDRTSVRESLADITSFDPSSHGESARLHRELLESYPARPGSWQALLRIAEQWQREPAAATCRQVLQLLGCAAASEGPGAVPLIRTECVSDAVVEAATELLCTLEDWEGLPEFSAAPHLASLPGAIRAQLTSIAGRACETDDAGLEAIFRAACERTDQLLSRRARRKVRRTLGRDSFEEIAALDPARWREHALAQAAAQAVAAGEVELEEAMRALLACCRETEQLELAGASDPGAILQLCPPARALLLRVADACTESLGLNL